MKIKIVEPGFEGMNGAFGDVEFVDGISKDEVTALQAARLANLVRIENIEDGSNPSTSQKILDSGVVPMDANLGAVTVEPEKQKAAHAYTRAELEKIADDSGIEGLRKIADPLGLKSRSIANLVEQILATTKSEDAPSPEGLLGSSVLPSTFEINGVSVPLGDIVRAAFEKSGMTAKDWNEQPAEVREKALADALAEKQAG